MGGRWRISVYLWLAEMAYVCPNLSESGACPYAARPFAWRAGLAEEHGAREVPGTEPDFLYVVHRGLLVLLPVQVCGYHCSNPRCGVPSLALPSCCLLAEELAAGFPAGASSSTGSASALALRLRVRLRCSTQKLSRGQEILQNGCFTAHTGGQGLSWHPHGRPHAGRGTDGHAAGSPFLPAVHGGRPSCASPGGRAGINAPGAGPGERPGVSGNEDVFITFQRRLLE